MSLGTAEAEKIKMTTASEPEAWTRDHLDSVKRFQKINKNDFYAVLDIESTASEVDIKKAYRKMALLYHPDKNRAPGADEAFKAVGRAFAVLSNPQNKAQYDRFGAEVASDSHSTNFSGSPFASNPFDELSRRHPEFFEMHLDTEDIFNMFFSELMSQANPRSNFRFASKRYQPTTSASYQSARARQQNAQMSPISILAQLIPLFVLLILSFLNSLLFSGWND